jgi:hypothetical protein
VFRDKNALEHITTLEKTSPKELKSIWAPGADPMHSTGPYYFISEAITSAIVAVGIYGMTRVLGPLIGTKRTSPAPASIAPVVALAKDSEPSKAPVAANGTESPLNQVTDIHAAKREERARVKAT